MRAERNVRGQPTSRRLASALLALGLGLASAAVGSATVATAVDPTPTRVTIVAPLVVPTTTTGIIGIEALTQYTSPFGLLTRQLDAVIDRPVVIAIDPMILVSIRLLGSDVPASASAWLDRLGAASNQTFPLVYGDSDITLATQAGSAVVLQPEQLGFAIDPALFAQPTPSGSPTPVPTGDTDTQQPVAPPLPTTADLLAWPYTLTDIAWPRDNTVIGADLPKIQASGYSTTILDSANVTRETPSSSLVDLDGRRALVVDGTVSAAARLAATAVGAEAFASASAALTASLAAVGAGASVVVSFDRALPPSGGGIADTITAIEATPGVQLASLAEAMGAAATPATLIDSPQQAERLSRAGQLVEAEDSERRFATVATDPTTITSERRIDMLAVFASGWANKPEGWATASNEFLTESVLLRNSVHLVKSSSFLLVADNGQFLPITVSNALPQPVTVYVTVTPESALLAVDNPLVELQLDANSQAKVSVPVRSLSNGVVEVEVSLTSVAGVPIGAPIRAEVTVQAGWETPIVIFLAILVVATFGFGIVRTVLRRRRGAPKVPADD